jgi:hypothetical protein
MGDERCIRMVNSRAMRWNRLCMPTSPTTVPPFNSEETIKLTTPSMQGYEQAIFEISKDKCIEA